VTQVPDRGERDLASFLHFRRARMSGTRRLFARVCLDDGWLERAHRVVDASEVPATGAYVTLDDGRRVQVIGHARHADGRLLYLVVRPEVEGTFLPDAASAR
jgi:hypothetical protein